MSENRSEGFSAHHGKKKLKPSLNGEKWLMFDGQTVQVLRILAGGAVEVILPSGKSAVMYGSEFKKRLEPPVPEDVL